MSKARIRQANRRGTRSEKSPAAGLTRRTPASTACHGCGALFVRKTWRHDHRVAPGLYDRVLWRLCPACRQSERGEGFGKVVVPAEWARANDDVLRRRIANVAARARHTQPERRVVSATRAGRSYEIVTTSQKLAHRLARELEKAFGGRAAYRWSSDDGSLSATWAPGAGRAAATKRGAR